MSEFKPINTQEEFDAAIKDRLERERGKFSDYESLKTQVGTLTTERDTAVQQLSDANAKIKTYETNSVKMRIAQEKGLPAEMALRLTGETEEDIAKDADSMVQIFKATKGTAPLFDNTSGAGDDQDAALKQMLQNLNM